MEYLFESWSLVVILLSALVIGWAAETAQTFMSRALALSILAWLQTLPEFAVEATIAWNQQNDLMIANLTGSLRLLVGLGWPMIFFTHFFFQGMRYKKFIKEIHLDSQDYLSVLFLGISILYFLIILFKDSLTIYDSFFLILIYAIYLIILMRLPASEEGESEEELPWIGQKIVKFNPPMKISSVIALFAIGGIALYLSAHPFVATLEKWSIAWGISTFVFIQWVSPFLSEFPEKVSAFNWARQKSKAPMAVMNMVNSNINQWTMLAAMIPLVYSVSLGYPKAVVFDDMHWWELALTIAQSVLGGVLLLDLKFSFKDASILFLLWLIQFIWSDLRHAVTYAYLVWIAYEVFHHIYRYARHGEAPRVIKLIKLYGWTGAGLKNAGGTH